MFRRRVHFQPSFGGRLKIVRKDGIAQGEYACPASLYGLLQKSGLHVLIALGKAVQFPKDTEEGLFRKGLFKALAYGAVFLQTLKQPWILRVPFHGPFQRKGKGLPARAFRFFRCGFRISGRPGIRKIIQEFRTFFTVRLVRRSEVFVRNVLREHIR